MTKTLPQGKDHSLIGRTQTRLGSILTWGNIGTFGTFGTTLELLFSRTKASDANIV